MENRSAKLLKWESIALIAVFLCIIYIPWVDNFFDIDSTQALVEKRELIAMPTLSLEKESIEKFPKRFDAYYNDHFGFRNLLVRYNALSNYLLFNVSTTQRITVGKEGWLFFVPQAVDYTRAVEPLSPEQLIRWKFILEQRRDWLQDRKIPYIFVVAHNLPRVSAGFSEAGW